jgi:Zn finger protein HypA/HybF involved in hydrogenase expression
MVDRGVIPCGCSAQTRWKDWQWEVMVKRKAEKLGFSFIGFPSGAKSFNSLVSLRCSTHGEWDTTRIANFLNGHACPKCGLETNAQSLLIPDETLISKALSGESYKAGTILIPGQCKSSKWILICPSCESDEISISGVGPSRFSISRKNVMRGLVPCRCSQTYRMTLKELEHKALVASRSKGYEFGGWHDAEKKKNTSAMVSAICADHGLFRISFANLVYHDRRCPACAKYGFKIEVDGYVYALRSECGAYMKVGITNKPGIRIPQLSKATPFPFSVDGVFKTSGSNARDIERSAHNEFMSAGLSGFDGCTEWLRYEPEIIKYVEQRAL